MLRHFSSPRAFGRPVSAAVLGLFALIGGGLVGCGGGTPEPTTAQNPPGSPSTAASAESTAAARSPAAPTIQERRAAGKAAFEAKDWTKAKTELAAVVAQQPNDGEAQKMLGDIYATEGDAKAATDAYFAASKADGGKDEILALAAAQGLWAQQRYDDLLGLMQLATKVDGRGPSMPLWMYLGMAQVATGDYAAAVETYSKLTQTFPDEPELWADLALAQDAANKKDDAKKTAKTALDKWVEVRTPKSSKDVKLGKGPDELAMIARAMRRAGDAAGAIAAVGKYPLPKDELAPQLDVEHGFAKRTARDGKTAQADANKALKARGDDYAPAHLLLAAVAADAKKADEAKSHLDRFQSLARRETFVDYVVDLKAIERELAGAPSGGATAPGASKGPAPSAGKAEAPKKGAAAKAPESPPRK